MSFFRSPTHSYSGGPFYMYMYMYNGYVRGGGGVKLLVTSNCLISMSLYNDVRSCVWIREKIEVGNNMIILRVSKLCCCWWNSSVSQRTSWRPAVMVTAQFVIVSPYECTYGGYYGLVVVTPPRLLPRPCPQTFHRSHNNLINPYRIASILYICRMI